METWNTRVPKIEEERRYRNLIDLHQLTQEWLIAVHPQDPKEEAFRLKRFIPPELSQNLWLLEKLRLDQLPPRLETLVNETTVTEFLDELEETLWLVQASILENILGNSDTPNRNALYNQLEQVTWHHGKTLADERWPNFAKSFESDAETLTHRIFNALKNSPFYSSQSSFLLERMTDRDILFYWLTSPLSRESLQVSPELMTLNHLHHHCLRGFLYGLIRKLSVEVVPSTLRETKVWNVKVLLST